MARRKPRLIKSRAALVDRRQFQVQIETWQIDTLHVHIVFRTRGRSFANVNPGLEGDLRTHQKPTTSSRIDEDTPSLPGSLRQPHEGPVTIGLALDGAHVPGS